MIVPVDLAPQSDFLAKPLRLAGFLSPPFQGGTPNAWIRHLAFRYGFRVNSKFESRLQLALAPISLVIG